jgi:hypothetical protein
LVIDTDKEQPEYMQAERRGYFRCEVVENGRRCHRHAGWQSQAKWFCNKHYKRRIN